MLCSWSKTHITLTGTDICTCKKIIFPKPAGTVWPEAAALLVLLRVVFPAAAVPALEIPLLHQANAGMEAEELLEDNILYNLKGIRNCKHKFCYSTIDEIEHNHCGFITFEDSKNRRRSISKEGTKHNWKFYFETSGYLYRDND